jgi:16S rRNA (cytidine1402-2'-O)-methyltransferase
MNLPSRAAPGRLVLVPNTLDHGAAAVPIEQVLPAGALATAAGLTHWVVEDARSARAFLKRVDAVVALAAPLQQQSIVELPRPRKGARDDTPAQTWATLLSPAHAGHDVGLLSEAGLPAVADPGARLVEAAHRESIEVLPLPGPSALLLALAASGLNGQSFAFVGYLPAEPDERARRLRELEGVSRQTRQTQLFIETPYRNAAVVGTALAALQPSTRLAISCGLTLPGGWSRCLTVAAWRQQPPTLPERLPAVFALLAG